ncbi:hypothetical protein SAMN05421788_101860 [Filimonas lacunae]|uniref:Uncharacterized protein n=1 Tax=Filimonas lacunae TaxID=477680 RepID=A0A173MP39_9BACT|nr:hypothetical protein [Filimonas lacunae]BAV09423.1 hypothetical protein FLA_5472 [Filimonas lacunae]SIS72890.1 hypothetical protein SAMN05421788_101860 [Filimonas lacunae]
MYKKAHINLSRSLLIAGYLAFFMVQVYCNTSAIQSCFIRPDRTHALHKPHGISHVKAGQSPDHEKLNVLVNKKFHPENTLAVSYSISTPLPVYIRTTTVTIPVIHVTLTSLLTQSLRAPPAAALA